MTRLCWHTRTRTAELRGSEHAWLHQVAASSAVAAWGFESQIDGLDRAATLLHLAVDEERNYVHDQLFTALVAELDNVAIVDAGGDDIDPVPHARLSQQLRTMLAVDGYSLRVAGVELHTRDIVLNTALRVGPDPIRLAAKIDGWSSVHCWVEGPDRAWLAAIIQEGLDVGLYRHGMWQEPMRGTQPTWVVQGWEDIQELLRAADDDPVVLSYSVDGWFPNHVIADWNPDIPPDWCPDWAVGEDNQDWLDLPEEDRIHYRDEHRHDLFGRLPEDEQWDRAMAGLRTTRPWARLGPDTLARVTFGPPFSVFDLFAPDRDERAIRANAPGMDENPAS